MNRRDFLHFSGLLTSSALLSGASFVDRKPAHHGGGSPRRFVIFVEGNGTRPLNFTDPQTLSALESAAGGAVTTNRDYNHNDVILTAGAPLSEARSLSALAAGESGPSLTDKAAVLLGLSGTYLGGGHSTNHGALTASPGRGGPDHASIDAVLGGLAGVRGNTPFDVVRVGTGASGNPLNYLTCAFDSDEPAPVLLDPAASFSTLFGSVATGAAAEAFAARRALLDYAMDDVEASFEALSGSSRGRAKLETFEASLADLMTRDEQIIGMNEALQAVKPPEPGELDPDPYTSTAPLDRLNLQVDIATRALIGGLTNVVVVSMGAGGYLWSQQYPTLSNLYPNGTLIGGHDLRHSGSPDAANVLAELSRRYVGQMCNVARELDAIPEDGGTMLDNTLLLYMSDNGEKHHSVAEEWAMLLLGGSNMGFKTDGRAVAFPRVDRDNNRQTSNVFNSMLHGAGEAVDDFGHADPGTRVAEGPLSELWE
ncbi:MAG: DUF1552 domain-containing protein [Nannocystales bacterium]